jgi:hypothetical protein
VNAWILGVLFSQYLFDVLLKGEMCVVLADLTADEGM